MQLGGRSSLNEVKDFIDVMVGGCVSSMIVLELERIPRLLQPTLAVDVTKPGVVGGYGINVASFEYSSITCKALICTLMYSINVESLARVGGHMVHS